MSATPDFDPMEMTGPLETEDLHAVIETTLFTGDLLLGNGASTQYVQETVELMGARLGCSGLAVLVGPTSISITTELGLDYRTKIRSVPKHAVNMTIVSGVIKLTHRYIKGEVHRAQIAGELTRISRLSSHYPRWLVVTAVGLACASFARLFHGSPAVMAVTFVATTVGLLLRQEFAKRHVNQLFMITTCAFVSGVLACVGSESLILLADGAHWTSGGDGGVGGADLLAVSDASIAPAAAVLYLVPGVALINAVEDLIHGHLVMGISRGTAAAVISLALAIGLGCAVTLTGVVGL